MGSETSGARLDKRNTLLKWFIDCMTVGALGNTIVFLVLMGFMKGRSSEQIFAAIKNVPVVSSILRSAEAAIDTDMLAGHHSHHRRRLQDLADSVNHQFQPDTG